MAEDNPRPGENDLAREERLKKVLFKEEQTARNWQDTDLTSIRESSLNYYDRKPLGDEVDGQSKIVTSEYADTIESIMPKMMRAFASGESIVEFTPDKPGDEVWAKQATDYIPHLLMRENDGFTFFYWFIKDALMYRLSWAAVDLEEKKQTKTQTIDRMSAAEWAIFQQELMAKAEETGADVKIEVGEDEPGEDLQVIAAKPGAIAPPQTYSGTVTVTRKVQRVVVENVAPEDGLVTPMARHIDAASFVGYRKETTASELRVLGLKQDEIDALSSYEPYTVEAADRQPDALLSNDERNDKDDSERKLWVVVAFVRFDWDDDGISEMRRVVYAHAGGQISEIIENDEWTDGVAPIVSGSPILMSHTIEGRSLFDLVKDIQEIGTAVTRGMLDNTYLVNRPRPAISDKVDLASLIDWTPGMPIRMRQGAAPDQTNLTWVTVPPTANTALQVLQWKEQVQQKRTGVTPNSQGTLDADMNPTARGADLITAVADERIALIAGVLGETAFKRLFRLMYRAVKRASTGPVKYWRGPLGDMPEKSTSSWVEVDPTKWPDDMDLTVDVGVGTGNKQQQIQNLTMIGSAQEKLLQSPGGSMLVRPEHVANTARKLVETVGYKNSAQFVATPEEIDQAQKKAASQPPQADPVTQAAQAEVAIKQAESQSKLQMAREKATTDLQIQQQKLDGQLAIMREEMQQKIALQREQMQLDNALKRQELAEETRLKELEIRMRAASAPAPGGVDTNIEEQQLGSER